MKILETRDLKKYYGNGDIQVKALDGINLAIEEGEFAAVVGTSGSGKSTLLHMLGGLDYATGGTVTVAGKKIFELNENELTIFRRRQIGFIFQSYNLVPILSVYENIVLPVELDGRRVDETFLKEIVCTLGLENKLDNLPGQLSGGQQQRVAIARALVTKPSIILADEPTGNLDSRTTQEVLGLLKLTGEQFHQTIVMITHNEALAQLCDRVIHIEDGRIVDDHMPGSRPEDAMSGSGPESSMTESRPEDAAGQRDAAGQGAMKQNGMGEKTGSMAAAKEVRA